MIPFARSRMVRSLLVAWTGLTLLAGTAAAQSLSTLYQSARSYDASYQAAKAQYDATLAKAAQSKAGILPSVSLSSSVSRTAKEELPESERASGAQSATLSASQPLYRPANLVAYKQGQKQIDQAHAALQAAEQDLIVRVGQAYFDALSAADNLAFVRSQKAAVAEQLAAAKRNFEVGTATITDTREAQAKYDLVIAQEIAAENEVHVKNMALSQLIGQSQIQTQALTNPITLPGLDIHEVEQWVTQSNQHPSLQQLRIQLEIAKLETEKARAGHGPTLDLTSSVSASNSNNSTGSDSRTNQASIGLSFNLPLFSGFAVQNRLKETLALEEKARQDLEASQRTIAQNTRAAFYGVISSLGQVKALEAAEASSQSALDANKLGYQVGVRINIDVLNSQSQLFDTKAKLAKARYDVLLGSLKLRQTVGTLKAADLDAITALLTSAGS